MEIIWFILIGLIAGWLAGLIIKGGGFGVVGDIIIGIVGALAWRFSFSYAGRIHGRRSAGQHHRRDYRCAC